MRITSEERNQRILLVDDSADSLRLLQVTLKLKGYNVTIADSGAEALIQIAESPPNLVLLDVATCNANRSDLHFPTFLSQD
jgi:two-component system, sensor histidine kinase and response regulator